MRQCALMQRDQTMRDPAMPEPSRRRLFELIGASVGAAAAYQAMTRLGHAAELPYRGPIRLDGDPKGASVVILGAGLAGMTAAIELERAGYQRERARIQFPRRRTQLDDPRRRRVTPSLAARRKHANSTPASISIRGRGASPIITMRSSIIAAASASRSSPSSSSITTPIFTPPTRSAASRSASARSRPITTAASPSFSPRLRKRARSTMRCRRRIRRSCSKRCASLGALDTISATGWARIRRRIGAMRSFREAVSARSRSPASRSGSTTF